jgi:NET1-associated nuclear protein 1 (U3 small nucleolar RNA-associated protein 17)
VSSLSLSVDGRYLYSGGEEGVLVVWQLGSGHKDFVPRLGAAIAHVAAR